MRFVKVVSALILVAVFATSVFSQDAVIELNSEGLGVHQRPIVEFGHEQHADILECLRCHHNFDQYGNNTGSEGQPCSDCHTKAAGENPVRLQEAFHTQCKRCHEQVLEKSVASGPVMCGECHSKR